MEKQDNTQVTEANIYVGMPVSYFKAPKAVPFRTQVITAPRDIEGEICVNVAMIGDAVPIAKLKKMEERQDIIEAQMITMHGNRHQCGGCGVPAVSINGEIKEYPDLNMPNTVWMLCDICHIEYAKGVDFFYQKTRGLSHD